MTLLRISCGGVDIKVLRQEVAKILIFDGDVYDFNWGFSNSSDYLVLDVEDELVSVVLGLLKDYSVSEEGFVF